MKRLLRDWLPFFAILLLTRGALADIYQVPSGSMEPTVQVGDRVLVDKRAYGLRIPATQLYLTRHAMPAPGDVVVLDSPVDGRVLLKRVVAIEGDKVFVMGDNRDNSFDSRSFGPVDKDAVLGRVRRVYWRDGGLTWLDPGAKTD